MATVQPLTSKDNEFQLELTDAEVDLYRALQGRWDRKIELKEIRETEKQLMQQAASRKSMEVPEIIFLFHVFSLIRLSVHVRLVLFVLYLSNDSLSLDR